MSEGGCLCGAVRYRISGIPTSSVVCHCTSCRRASGAPTVAWVTVDRGKFELLRGTPLAYQSSPGVTRQFCGRCGSALTYANSSDSIDITTASLDEPDAFPPTADVWLEDKVAWQATDDEIGKFIGSSVG